MKMTLMDATRMMLVAMARESGWMLRNSIWMMGPPSTKSPTAQGMPMDPGKKRRPRLPKLLKMKHRRPPDLNFITPLTSSA